MPDLSPGKGLGPADSALNPPARIVVCPRCSKEYRLTQPVLEKGLVFTCQGCRSKLIVRPKTPPSKTAGMSPDGTGPSQFTGTPHGSEPPLPQNLMTGQTGPAVRPLTATCPGCLKSFTCQLPVGDNWTLCPLCGEKFLAGRDSRTWLVLEGSPRKTDFGRTKVIGDGGRIDLGYATDKVSQVYEIGILEYLPGQKKKIFLYAALAVFVFLVFWARIVISSWQAAGDLTDDNPQAVLAATTVSYDDRAFYQDILKFRKWSKNRTFADYVLSQPDMSTRLYKYAIARLSPDSCQEFTSLTLNSRPRGAITMVGTCFQERLANPVLDIDFKDRQAVFSVPESREVIQKDIFPSEPDNGLDGANNPK